MADQFGRWLGGERRAGLDHHQRELWAAFLREMRLNVPRDLAFVDVFLEDFGGATAGVRQNHRTVGGVAVEILAGQLQHNKFGVPEIPTTTYVEGTWFGGATCPAVTPRG